MDLIQIQSQNVADAVWGLVRMRSFSCHVMNLIAQWKGSDGAHSSMNALGQRLSEGRRNLEILNLRGNGNAGHNHFYWHR